MILLKSYNYMKGYVTLFLEGYQLERFLNMAINENIFFWDIKRLSASSMRVKVRKEGFKKLRRIAFKTKTKVKIQEKTGLANYIKRLRHRKVFLIATILAIAIFFIASSFILNIEVTGNQTVTYEQILEKLSEINLKKGSFRGNIDIDKITVKLMNDLDNLSWVGVEEKGTRLQISVKERILPPTIVPKEIPCHIIARQDGVIMDMTVENGEAKVKIKDIVVKGQMLVSGILDTKMNEIRYVHSMGSIIGKTWKEEFVEKKLYHYEKEYTGNTQTVRYLSGYGYDFPLWFDHISKFFNYDTATTRKVFGPLDYEKRVYTEYNLHKKPISEEQALAEVKEEMLESLKKVYNENQIINVTFEHNYIDEETIKIRMLSEIKEEIGEQLELTKE